MVDGLKHHICMLLILLGILIYPFKGVDGHIPLTTFFKLSKNGNC